MSCKFEKMVNQAKLWDLFARIVPLASVILTIIGLILGFDFFQLLLYVGTITFILVMIVWWFWAVFSVAKLSGWRRDLSKSLDKIDQLLCQNRDELKDIKRDLENEKDRSL